MKNVCNESDLMTIAAVTVTVTQYPTVTRTNP